MNQTWAYCLVVLSAVCLGIANFVFPRASRALGGANATFYYYVLAFLLAGLYWLPAREHRPWAFSDLQWPLWLTLAMFTSNVAYSYGTRYLDTTFPSVIRGLSFLVTGALAVYVNRETLAAKDWLALALVAGGLILFGYGRSNGR